MDVITSRVEYRSSVFIKTVFEATFSFSNILQITQATFSLVLHRCSTVPESVFLPGLDTKIGILLGFLESNEMFRKFQDFQTIMFIKIQWNPALRPPRYCDHFFVARTKAHSFSYLKTPLIRPPRYYDQRPPLGVLGRYFLYKITPLIRPVKMLGGAAE